MAETNKNTTGENDTKALEKTVKVVPNAESWRYITEGNAFKVCLNMKTKDIYKLSSTMDTHQMKNTEWEKEWFNMPEFRVDFKEEVYSKIEFYFSENYVITEDNKVYNTKLDRFIDNGIIEFKRNRYYYRIIK